MHERGKKKRLYGKVPGWGEGFRGGTNSMHVGKAESKRGKGTTF